MPRIVTEKPDVLIHEALHTAGLKEATAANPAAGPTSQAIQQMVNVACGF